MEHEGYELGISVKSIQSDAGERIENHKQTFITGINF